MTTRTPITFTGTGALLRLALRRDRILLPIWLIVFAGMAASSASATVGLYPTEAERVQASAAFNTVPSLVAIYGRVYDPTSLGALSMIKLGGFGAVLVALLSIILIGRHTRAEEEAGRQELVGAGAVGRRAPLTAALLLTLGTNVLLALLTALGLTAAGLPAAGSAAFGLAWGGVGIAFAAIAAVTAQLTTTRRSATGIAAGVLGTVYLLRAIGDTAGPSGSGWLTWASPIGWGQQFRPYAGDRWWVLLLTVGFALVVTAGAYTLVGRRDVGAGMFAVRRGPAAAALSLRGPYALAWRLQRGSLLAWSAGFLVLGLVVGTIASSVGGFLRSEQAQDMITRLGGEHGLTDAYLAAMLGIIGILASAYGVQAAMRLRTEETSAHIEPLLAAGVTRTALVLSHTTVAVLGTTVLMLVAGVTAGGAYAAQVGDAAQLPRLLGGALVQLPAAWVLTGIVVAGFGLVPRAAVIGWAALTGFVLLGEVGPLLRLDQWARDVSPFAHVPRLPGAVLDPTPIVALTAVAVVLVAAGIAGFTRRDVPTA